MNKLFDIVIIGAGTKGKRIAKKLAKDYDVAVIDPSLVAIDGVTRINREAIYVAYVRGIIGVILDGESSPEIFAKRLIIAAPSVKFLPANFYNLDSDGKVIINQAGQLPALKPLVYVANKIAIGYGSTVETTLVEAVKEGLK